MRVEEKIEQFGTFWIAENPDEKIKGKLIVEDGGYITVELYDIFENFKRGNEPKSAFRINGTIYGYNSKLPTKIVLEQCLFERSEIIGNGYSSMSAIAHRLIIGAECIGNEDILVDKFSFSFEGIELCIGKDLRKYDAHENKLSFSYSLGEIETIYNGTVKMPGIYIGNIDINIVDSMKSSKTVTKMEFERETKLEISFNQPIPILNVEGILNHLSTFFSIAIAETANIKNVCIFNSVVTDDKQSNKMEFYFQEIIFSKDIVSFKSAGNMLLLRNHIQQNNLLKKWLEGSRFICIAFQAYSMYIADKGINFPARFGALTQAIEILHTRKIGVKEHSERCKNNLPNFHCKTDFVNLKCRIQDLIEEFQDSTTDVTCSIYDIDKIAMRITHTRNDLTHHSVDGNEKKFNLSYNVDFYEAMMAVNLMERLFQCAFLSEVGFSNSEIEGIVKKP